MSKEKLIIIFTVFVDVIGFGMVIPILPFYVTSFGASAFTVTMLFSCFSFFAFLSSPFLGALSDRIGRRPVLLLSILSTSIGWIVFASAVSIPMLFLGRIIDGAAAGNFTTAQSYLVDISKSEKERTANLGVIGATFGVGFMVGPLLGGALSSVSHSLPFWLAGILAFINTVIAFFMLPETHHTRNTETPLSFNPLAPLARAATDTVLRPLYLTWILFFLAFITSQTIFALYTNHAFGMDSFTTGALFSAIGIIVAINQALLLKSFWLKRFSEPNLEIGMIILLTISLLLMGSGILPLFYLGLALSATAQSVLRVVITSQVAGKAPPSMKGEKLGILTSLMAAMMVIGPIISGALFEIRDYLPFIGGAAFMLIALVVALQFRRTATATEQPTTSMTS
ncbi:MAG: MFS transporter [Ignavibacteriales bacterium]|nr:MFS transporter [Ignavibacteriales bacterium]